MDQKVVVGVGGLVLGAALGFGGGWLARAPSPAADGPTLGFQPTGPLSKETAKALLEADYGTDEPGKWCFVEGLIQKSTTKVTLNENDRTVASCIKQLEAEGIAIPGECADTGIGDRCFARAVSPGKNVKPSKLGTIAFGCGEFKVTNVTSVTTEGNKATVVFEREFASSGIVEKVSDCKISQPTAGVATKTREFQRDDSGTWRSAKKP